MLPVSGKFGQAVVPGVDEKLTVPLSGRHSVTAPPPPTDNRRPLTVPLPIGPATAVGGFAVLFCAKPLASTRLVSFAGSSMPTSVHVEKELDPRVTAR